MTPLNFLTQVKDHVTDTNGLLTEEERIRLRSVTVRYRPPGTDPWLEFEDRITGSYHWGFTPIGEKPDGRPGNTGVGSWEIGPINIFGHSHMDWPLCVMGFTVLHEMGHVLAPAISDKVDAHGPDFVAACARLGIEEHPYGVVKSVKGFKSHGWKINHITDPVLLAYIEGLGPITDWCATGQYRPVHERIT